MYFRCRKIRTTGPEPAGRCPQTGRHGQIAAEGGEPMVRAVYEFRPGALDRIAGSLGITDDRDLAASLRVTPEELHALRNGAPVGLPMAVHVASLMGTPRELHIWTRLVSRDTD